VMHAISAVAVALLALVIWAQSYRRKARPAIGVKLKAPSNASHKAAAVTAGNDS
jgi:hypothetical protein